jgi:hypothetical protein
MTARARAAGRTGADRIGASGTGLGGRAGEPPVAAGRQCRPVATVFGTGAPVTTSSPGDDFEAPVTSNIASPAERSRHPRAERVTRGPSAVTVASRVERVTWTVARDARSSPTTSARR